MNALDALREDDIQTKGSLISTAEALRVFLRTRSELASVKRAIDNSVLSPSDIIKYVSGLLRSFRPGERFADDITLAAIAVILENVPGGVADEYLKNLAGLRIQELPMAPRVARLALLRRKERLTGLTDRKRVISAPFPRQYAGPTQTEPIPIAAGLKNQHFRWKAAS